MSRLQIEQFLCGADNFGVLIHDADAGLTAAIDTPEHHPIQAKLDEKGWRLTHIFTTHHHGDHIAGHRALKAEYACEVLGGAKDEGRIPGLDHPLAGGDRFHFGQFAVDVIDTPGHTLGHISYHLPQAGVAFVGDTLFSLGCGRLLEGDGPMMRASLEKLNALPGETQIYCGHEYTASNAAFALTVEPGNDALRRRAAEVAELRRALRVTLPARLSDEQAANPFLRAHSAEIQTVLDLEGRPPDEIFTELRRRKDNFR